MPVAAFGENFATLLRTSSLLGLIVPVSRSLAPIRAGHSWTADTPYQDVVRSIRRLSAQGAAGTLAVHVFALRAVSRRVPADSVEVLGGA